MHLAYFDENKYSEECPHFYVGGIILDSGKIDQYEKTISQIQYNFFGSNVLIKDTEIHGKDIFHGKGAFRKRKLADRIALLENIKNYLIHYKIPIRMVNIDVKAHKARYAYPEPEYHLGLMLLLERICDYLDSQKSHGLIFGDYERDEVSRSVHDFSQFKIQGKTNMYGGRPLGRLIDTIYYTQSHHSRFLQIADVVVFMAGRCENRSAEPSNWHDKQMCEFWNELKAGSDFKMQKWP
jgi:hypothetical protein